MFDPVVLPVPRTLGFVGFDAADVVRGAFHQSLDQTVRLFLEEEKEQLITSVESDPSRGGAVALTSSSLTLIFVLAVLGRPLFSASRFSGNNALIN